MRMSRALKIILGLLLAAGVAATGGTWVYLNVLRDDAPERLTLDTAADTTSTTASAAQATDAASSLDGTWTVAGGSRAGYRVEEVLFGQRAEAVGRTSDVTGSITLVGTRVTAGSFTVDMRTVMSNESRRDGQFRGRIMNVAQYPTATFVLSRPIEVGTLPAADTPVDAEVTGRLTARGTTRQVTFTVQARRSGSTISVAGTIPIVFADYGISNPSGGPAQTEDNGEVEFLLNLAR